MLISAIFQFSNIRNKPNIYTSNELILSQKLIILIYSTLIINFVFQNRYTCDSFKNSKLHFSAKIVFVSNCLISMIRVLFSFVLNLCELQILKSRIKISTYLQCISNKINDLKDKFISL